MSAKAWFTRTSTLGGLETTYSYRVVDRTETHRVEARRIGSRSTVWVITPNGDPTQVLHMLRTRNDALHLFAQYRRPAAPVGAQR